MREPLKRRLIGAAVLISLALVFVPMLLRNPSSEGPKPPDPPEMPEPPSAAFESRLLKDEVPKPIERPAPVPAVPSAASPPEQPPEQPAVTGQERVGLSAWAIQVASLSDRGNADKLVEQLRKAGMAAFVEQVERQGKTLFRVRIGPELERAQAEALLPRVKKAVDLDGEVVRYP